MIEEEDSIQDIFGQDILPGSIVAISRSNRNALQELSIVTSFGYRGRGRVINLIRIGWSWNTRSASITIGWLNSPCQGFNNDVIVIEPTKAFLALNNKRVQSLIEAVDIAKDKKLLPSDYKLGKPFSDEQIFPEIE